MFVFCRSEYCTPIRVYFTTAVASVNIGVKIIEMFAMCCMYTTVVETHEQYVTVEFTVGLGLI